MVDARAHEDICTFCCEVAGGAYSNLFFDLSIGETRDDYILYETEHFVVIPCIGALTDWYVLIVSRRHVLSVGWLVDEERRDLRRVLARVRQELRTVSGRDTIVFEHGSYDFRDKGGACYDHAHVHVVAAERGAKEFLRYIPDTMTMLRCNDWVEYARSLVQEKRVSYLALESDQQEFIGIATGAPSQFFRRCLAKWLGVDAGEWDWLVYPQVERVKSMARIRF